jgi:hypothetical protein
MHRESTILKNSSASTIVKKVIRLIIINWYFIRGDKVIGLSLLRRYELSFVDV